MLIQILIIITHLTNDIFNLFAANAKLNGRVGFRIPSGLASPNSFIL